MEPFKALTPKFDFLSREPNVAFVSIAPMQVIAHLHACEPSRDLSACEFLEFLSSFNVYGKRARKPEPDCRHPCSHRPLALDACDRANLIDGTLHPSIFHASRFVERGAQSSGELQRIVVRPEMHEEQSRLLS